MVERTVQSVRSWWSCVLIEQSLFSFIMGTKDSKRARLDKTGAGHELSDLDTKCPVVRTAASADASLGESNV